PRLLLFLVHAARACAVARSAHPLPRAAPLWRRPDPVKHSLSGSRLHGVGMPGGLPTLNATQGGEIVDPPSSGQALQARGRPASASTAAQLHRRELRGGHRRQEEVGEELEAAHVQGGTPQVELVHVDAGVPA
ncbi:unnamed protein product, partial [Ectocarpus sp. 12 AP-2014]